MENKKCSKPPTSNGPNGPNGPLLESSSPPRCQEISRNQHAESNEEVTKVSC